jgi:hypothetical protein
MRMAQDKNLYLERAYRHERFPTERCLVRRSSRVKERQRQGTMRSLKLSSFDRLPRSQLELFKAP